MFFEFFSGFMIAETSVNHSHQLLSVINFDLGKVFLLPYNYVARIHENQAIVVNFKTLKRNILKAQELAI